MITVLVSLRVLILKKKRKEKEEKKKKKNDLKEKETKWLINYMNKKDTIT